MKTFYSEYVQHCMRFYSRHPNPKFRSEVDKRNWNACASALKGFTNREKDILIAIYQMGDTIPDNIFQISMTRNTNQDEVWQLIGRLEHIIAKRRGLI